MDFGQEWRDEQDDALGNRTMSEFHVNDSEGNEVQVVSCMVPDSAIMDETGVDVIKIIHERKVIVALAESLINNTIASGPTPMAGMYAVGVMVGSMMNDIGNDALCEFFHEHEE
jgi:hypothetical protein